MTDRPILIRHRDDTPWWESPLPWRLHWCRPQTVAIDSLSDGTELLVERCPCGAARLDFGHWINRNETRNNRRNRRRLTKRDRR
jgi:hypothetical protein